MASRKHLDVIRSGSDKWNKWSARHLPEDVGAKLAKCNLSGRDLFGAILTGADLRNALLSNTSFHFASFKSANLEAADLSNADLKDARMDYANLCEADLSGAELVNTVFHQTRLMGANLEYASLGSTVFIDTDLGGVKGLDLCRHFGPSVLDFHTMARSWPIPLSFLRGCGLPEIVIEYLPSLLNKPIQFYSCFISYST